MAPTAVLDKPKTAAIATQPQPKVKTQSSMERLKAAQRSQTEKAIADASKQLKKETQLAIEAMVADLAEFREDLLTQAAEEIEKATAAMLES